MKPIRELITGRSVLALRASATAFEAAQAMTANKCGCVLITDKEGHPEGIFTERDLMTRVIVLGKDPNGVRLEEVMTKDMYVVEPDLRIQLARVEMSKRHIRHLPIAENGKLIAVLSLRDILRADLEDYEKNVEAMTAYIQGEANGVSAD